MTTLNQQGEPVGLTANSFNSVSLTPPLVLWSQNRQSSNASVFSQASYFAVNILEVGQAPLARQFASKVADRFAGVSYELAAEGVPLLTGCLAWLVCRRQQHYEAGDHLIHLAEVVACQHQSNQAPGLVFHRGQFFSSSGGRSE
ncbi:flavin reductase [Parvibium lacunae]|uniref:Flavin reductase n=2 Tax=Parvibium lacunae TaxID=1888893 RepID=A0A368L8D5_9BURK|nr:flavin reductase [Parvibium lacunae]